MARTVRRAGSRIANDHRKRGSVGESTAVRPADTGAMHAASDNDLRASLLLADKRYNEVHTRKVAQKRANRSGVREALEVKHAAEEEALRYAAKDKKEAGRAKRAHEKEKTLARLERGDMAEADEDSRVRIALLTEKYQAVETARDAHVRRFDDPGFHFVPRRKMMQIQSGCIKTICQVLDQNNKTNTWQRKDACVVEQCLSALALYVHRRPERCQALQDSNGGVQAIVTGMRECAGNGFVQEKGLKLVDEACLTLATCAEAFVCAGALETIVAAMEQLADDRNLQTCGCEAITSVVTALPDSGELRGRVIESGVHQAAAQALHRHAHAEDVLAAGMRALESIVLICGAIGQASVEKALSDHRSSTCSASADSFPAVAVSLPAFDSYTTASDSYTAADSACADSAGSVGRRIDGDAASSVSFDRGGDQDAGAIAFTLRVANAYSRDDSRTIVRRAGAARLATGAFDLLRALLTDCAGMRGQEKKEEKEQEEKEEEEKEKKEEEEDMLLAFVDEFCREQGVEIIVSAMEHHVHDANVLLAAWQAMYSIIRLSLREQRRKVGEEHVQIDVEAKALAAELKTGEEEIPGKTGLAEALLHRGQILERAIRALARSMDVHLAVAPLQWICLVCLAGVYALDTRVADFFMIQCGCQILHRCIRTNARHTAVVEQACRAVAVMSEPSFTSRTRFFVEKIQDSIHEVLFLHRRHPGVQTLGNRALDALWGADDFGAKQKAAAAERLRRAEKEDKL